MSLFTRFRRRRSRGMKDSASADEAVLVEDVTSSAEERVAGERGQSAVQRPPSLQSRVSNFLAVGLMGTLAVGLLGWYSMHSLGSRTSARAAAQASAQEKAKGEMTLRPLGRVDPPLVRASPAIETLLGDAPEEPPPAGTPEAWLRPAHEQTPTYAATRSPTDKTPEQLRLERQLAGPAFSSPAASSLAASISQPGEGSSPMGSSGEMEGFLRPSMTAAVSAKMLPTQRLLLPKGAFIDCTLETAIDSSLPGMTTCVMATDSFSADGSVVLLERGTKLVGETRGQVRAGSARIFVLWTEARTPQGIVVPLASPGTDELGRAGLPGEVNRHFFERFGAAILVSVIDGAVQTAVQSQREDGETIVVSPSGSSQIMTEVLKSTIGIPPTVVKPQGDRIAVLVARDLDFRSVYELRPVAVGR
ncbi:MAG: type IV secretion system protein VirB10 [Steroidobacteraceae bacterium]